MNRFFVLAIVSTLLASSAYATTFTDCGSTSGEVTSVQVTDCPDGQDECILKRGTQAGITVSFTAKADSSSLKTVVHGVIASVPLPFPIPNPDACKTGVSCPVKNGQIYTYNNSLNIRKSYPPVSVTVRWELKDANNDDMVCVEIPAKLE